MKKGFIGIVLLAIAFSSAPAIAKINALDAVPAATLLLPHFEVDLTGAGPVTVLHVGNASSSAVLTHLTLWTDQGVPTRAFDIYLGGKDTVEIDLRLLLQGIVPQAARVPWPEAVGALSTGPVAFPGCPSAPLPDNGRLSAAEVAGLQAAHQGLASSLFGGGRCAGKAWGDGIARGYVTIDTVSTCSPTTTFPSTAGYFTPGPGRIATNQNVLFGEYSIVDRSNNYDVSDNLVHIEASATDPRTSTSGKYTFYGRLASVNGTAVDNREALHNTWMARFVGGGIFSGGTRAVVWRDPGPSADFPCGSPPAGIGQAGVSVFDEQEQAGALPGVPHFPLAAESVALDSAARIPLPFSFGFLWLGLDRSAVLAPFGTRNQAFVGVQYRASGRFAAASTAYALGQVDDNPNTYYSGSALVSQCNDGIDNDGDGLIDYPADPFCTSPYGTAEGPSCSDGVDNDGDGLIDFPADPGCASPADQREEDGFNNQCNDGIDNDGDGRIDYPADTGCFFLFDLTESPDPQCSDGIDNDGDGFVDFPADPFCTSPTGNAEAPACSDGVDNDGDGLTDFPADPGCKSALDQNENDATDNQCGDGIDNDGDGLIDFPADPGCANVAGTLEKPQCSDGIDNDGDGLVDFPADKGCTGFNDNSEAGEPQCNDGIDNDGNGFIDYPIDPGCNSAFDNAEKPACSDGEDNDNDGFTDFPADVGCASALDQTEETGSTLPQCSDGVDNDGDGLIDFPLDPGCISRYDRNEFDPAK